METSRRSFPTAVGWFRRAPLPPHAEEHRSPGELECVHSSAVLRCVSKHEGIAAHPSRRAHARPDLRQRFRTRAPQDWTAELAARRRTVFGNSHLTMSNSPSRSRGAFLRPGFATLLHQPRIEGWAERRETFGCSAEHPWGTPSCVKDARERAYDAARQAPCEA